jgi:chromosome segregation ATPase
MPDTFELIAHSAEALANRSSRMGERLQTEASRQADSLHDLGGGVAELSAVLESAVSHRRERLRGLQVRIADLRHHLASSLAHVDTQAHDLKQSLQHQRDQLDDDVRATIHAQDELRVDLDSHAHALADQGAHVVSEAGRFAHDVDAWLEQLRGEMTSLRDHLSTFDHEVASRVTAVAHDLQHIGERSEHLTTELSNRLHSLRGRLRDTTHRSLLDGVISSLESSSRQLHESLESVGQGALEGAQTLEEMGAGLGRSLEGVVRVIDEIRPILDMVHTVLG